MKLEVKDLDGNVLWEYEFEVSEGVESKVFYYGGAAGAQTAITPGTELVSVVLPITAVGEDDESDDEPVESDDEPAPPSSSSDDYTV